MPDVTFWGKPGCATNTRQIEALAAAGCTVTVCDLLTEAWTPAALTPFLAGRPVAQWFNPAAPAVKAGQVRPEDFDAGQALARLVAEPLLIRRPLLRLGGECRQGFDPQWLAGHGVRLPDAPVGEGCSHPGASAGQACPPPAPR